MKVLLIDPPDLFLEGQGLTRQVLPLGLACLGGVAREAGHEVRLLLPDARAYRGRDPWGEIEAALADEAPDVVGLTVVTPLAESAAEVASRARRVLPRALVVIGGPHVTASPVEALATITAADVAVRGEGEGPFAALLALHAAGRGAEAWGPIRGLAWRGSVGLASGGEPDPADWPHPDRLPLPLRDGLVWPADVQPALYQGLITQRGCPFSCSYCAQPASCGRLVRARAVALVVAEVRHLRERHGVSFLWLHDSVFPLDGARTVRLCDALVAEGLATPFSCQARPEPLAAPVLEALRRAGCVQVMLGLESGHPETLERIHRGGTVARAAESVRRLHDHGLRVAGFFMLGFPWETEAHLAATVDFALSSGLDALHLFAVAPLPGTGLAAEVGARPLPPRHDFRTPALNLTALPDARFRGLFDQARRAFDAYNRGVLERSLRNGLQS